MRQHRILEQGVWYEIRTIINNREPLFRHRDVLALFGEVFGETEKLFAFEIRGLRLEHDLLSFYIKPADGFQLPDIMKWMKQTLAARYNARTGRIGHVWGDRYWSRILDGEPPEWAEVCRDGAAGAIERAMAGADWPVGGGGGARGWTETAEGGPPPDVGARPRAVEQTNNTRLPPKLSRSAALPTA
jgi:REP element-mobilizing transposase RayT